MRLNSAGGTLPENDISFYDVNFTAPTTAFVANVDTSSLYLYSNGQNPIIPGVTVTPAPATDPFFNEAANAGLASFCQQNNQ